MKLFVWNDPYQVDYGSSILFVVAETEEQARAIVAESATFNSYGTSDRNSPVGWPEDMVAKLGAPLRIVEAPCAEFHQWSE